MHNKSNDIAALPNITPSWRQVTRQCWGRLAQAYAVVVAVGFVIASTSSNLTMHVFGLGLIFPAAGFIPHAHSADVSGLLHVAMCAAGLGVFALACGVWFATGNVLAPLLIWIVLAGVAAWMPHGTTEVSPLDIWMVLGWLVIIFSSTAAMMWCTHRLVIRQRTHTQHWLQHESPLLKAEFVAKPEQTRPELSFDDVKRLRFLLDRALQPVDAFDGFEWLDQFQTAALRYQINGLGYALSMAHAQMMPASGGYMVEAQRRLIEKLRHPRIWKYWELENLWGNLARNPDPIRRENIMFSGFAATQMVMYHAATQRDDYMHEGSFTLHHPSGAHYAYDLERVVECLAQQMESSAFHLMACEPNWIYPLCNMIGAAAIRAQQPKRWQQHASRFALMLDQEFLDYQGRIIACRSRYTGLGFPMIGGAMPQALPCIFLNALHPELAMRQWLLLRRTIMRDGQLQRKAFWRVDTGNYRFSRASAYASTALAASEMGDGEVYQACMDALEDECPTHTDAHYAYRPHASVWAHGYEFFARCNHKNTFKNMIEHAATPRDTIPTPRIIIHDYPEVLIASAHHDAEQLHAVLYPAHTKDSHSIIHVDGLRAHQHYAYAAPDAQGTLIADVHGKAQLALSMSGRTPLLLTPTHEA
jgi:hypothetical protein